MMRNAMMLALVLALAACAPKTDGTKAPGAAQTQSETPKTFMTKVGKEKGVVVLPSGLAYKIVRSGPPTGLKPQLTDEVKVHYEGKLLDGTVFDSSVARGEPIEFGVNQVIAGWTEGVQLMVEGEKTRFYIPANLAYGDRAAGKIPPGSVLIFDVELLGIQ